MLGGSFGPCSKHASKASSCSLGRSVGGGYDSCASSEVTVGGFGSVKSQGGERPFAFLQVWHPGEAEGCYFVDTAPRCGGYCEF